MSSLHKQLVDKWGLTGAEGDQKATVENNLGPLDPLSVAHQRIRELELELAETKLAHVEAACTVTVRIRWFTVNISWLIGLPTFQSLNHQLNNTISEAQANQKTSWQPWLSKKFNTIQEKVRKDLVQAGGGGVGGVGIASVVACSGKEDGVRIFSEVG